MIPSFARAACAVALACSLALAQQIWRVNSQGGPGVHFTDFPSAVAAASPGDTIMVWGGPHTATTINKPLHIFGLTIVTAPWTGPVPTQVGFKGVFTITGIPAGQRLTLSNIYSVPDLPPQPRGLEVRDCAGDVLIEDFDFWSIGIVGSTWRVERCANVIFRGCEVSLAGSPVFVEDSSLLLTTTSIRHDPPFSGTYGYVGTSHSLDVKNSTVTIVGSLVRGSEQMASGQLWTARAGAILNQSVLHVGPASLLTGGHSLGQPVYYASAYVPAVVSLGPSTVYADPRATVWNPPNLVLPPTPREIHATYHAWVVADEDYNVAVAGPVGGFALLAFGDWRPFPVVTPFGFLAIDPSNVQILDLVALTQPGGVHQWTFHCPPSAPNGYPFVFQALTLAPDGTLALTIPTPLTVGWEHGRIP